MMMQLSAKLDFLFLDVIAKFQETGLQRNQCVYFANTHL